jgi:hypothetical protein
VIWNQPARPWYPGWEHYSLHDIVRNRCLYETFKHGFSQVRWVRWDKHAIDGGCASEHGNSRLYKMKRMSPTETPKIYLVYPWEPHGSVHLFSPFFFTLVFSLFFDSCGFISSLLLGNKKLGCCCIRWNHLFKTLDVSKYLCRFVPHSVSEVGLIGWLSCRGP